MTCGNHVGHTRYVIEHSSDMFSDDYTSTKPKFTDRKGKKREYCDSGWSKEGKEFYNGVYQRWKVIAFKNDVCVWSSLEEEWALYAEENNFGNGYSRKKMRLDTYLKMVTKVSKWKTCQRIGFV